MTKPAQTLKAKARRDLWVAGDGGFLLELCGARVVVHVRVNVFATQKALDRAVVTARVASLIAGGKRVVKIAFDPKSFPADSVDDGVTFAADIRVFFFKSLN